MNKVTNTTIKARLFKVPGLEGIYIEFIKIYWWLGIYIKKEISS